MRILVTGAGGFLGRALLKQIASMPQVDTKVWTRAFGRWPGPGTAIPIALDLRNWTPNMEQELKGVDTVLHLAAQAASRAQTNLDDFMQSNCKFTACLAEASARNGVRHFVFVSTVKVCGEQSSGRPIDGFSPAAPQDAYAVSKYMAEQRLAEIATRSPMQVTVVRPPLVVGQNAGGNVRLLSKALVKGIPLPLKAFSQNRRSFIGVTDLADFLVTITLSSQRHSGPYVVQSGTPLSTVEFVQMLADGLGVKARLLYAPTGLLRMTSRLLGASDAFLRLAGDLEVDDSKARSDIGWTPPFGLAPEFRAMRSDLANL